MHFLSVGVKGGVIVYYNLIYHHRMLAYKKLLVLSWYRWSLEVGFQYQVQLMMLRFTRIPPHVHHYDAPVPPVFDM
jgi:hypothetical protein